KVAAVTREGGHSESPDVFQLHRKNNCATQFYSRCAFPPRQAPRLLQKLSQLAFLQELEDSPSLFARTPKERIIMRSVFRSSRGCSVQRRYSFRLLLEQLESRLVLATTGTTFTQT